MEIPAQDLLHRCRLKAVVPAANLPLQTEYTNKIAGSSQIDRDGRYYRWRRRIAMSLSFLISLISLSACGGGGSGSGTVQQPSSEFTYTINRNGTVAAFAVNRATGILQGLKGSPFSTAGQDSIRGAIDFFNRFLFVANQGSGDVSVFQILSSGALKLVPGSPFASGLGARATAVTQDLKFLYVANSLEDSVSAFSVDLNSGALTALAGSPFAIGSGSGPASLALNPAGAFLYVAGSNASKIFAFLIAADGSLSPVAGSPFFTGLNPSEITINPLGFFLYTTNSEDESISGFLVNSGTGNLIQLTGSPFPAGAAPGGASIDPSGRFLYVTNPSDDTISGFDINAATGALATIAGSPFNTGSSPADAVVDGTGNFLWVSNEGGDSVSGYRIDPGTGALSELSGSPFSVPSGSSPSGIVSAAF
jgi:6-phosphogluconolactonase (cycloisomerase 2 family)